jgi:CheY-like chemotaxis protein
MTRILVVEDNVKTRLLIVKMLKQLGEEEINQPKGYDNYTPNHDYGWYRKFEKKSKKR